MLKSSTLNIMGDNMGNKDDKKATPNRFQMDAKGMKKEAPKPKKK